MDITTQKAQESDLDFARETHHHAYRRVVEAEFGVWDDALQDRLFLNDWRGRDHDIVLCDGTPCGYYCVEYRAHDVHVREIVIHPDWQGRGIATRLLNQVRAEARRRTLPVRLGTFRSNSRALGLYAKLGFRQIGAEGHHLLLECRPYDRA